MEPDNTVIFKGRKNGLTVVMDKSASFDDIKSAMRRKVNAAKEFFGNTKTGIAFSGKNLSEDEEFQLIDIISKATDLSISFVTSDVGDMDVEGHTEKRTKNRRGTNMEELSMTDIISADENMTVFHKGSLRSGQSIQFVGSVVVVGDINPGAEIIAEGNVIVLGSIKGLVHAGCSGNSDCFAAALNLQPTQLRIADIITYIPKELNRASNKIPSYAFVKDGKIHIVPLNT